MLTDCPGNVIGELMKYKNTAYIDCGALVHNYNVIEEFVSGAVRDGRCTKKPRIICVVKADAYGHGIEAVSDALGRAGCDFFAVSSEMEAAELRALEENRGRHPDILILGPIDPENVGEMMRGDIICTAVSAQSARDLAAAVRIYNEENGTDMRLRIHVKLDTGMNRVGFAADEESMAQTVSDVAALVQEEEYSRFLSTEGIFTHFACADEELLDTALDASEGFTSRQLKRYCAVLDALCQRGVSFRVRHAANSAALLRLPPAYFDAVRAGIILYGLTPNTVPDRLLKPVMRLESTVTHIHTVKKGQTVSYGGTFTADRDMTVATVAAGYADGFLRHFSGCEVKIRSKNVRQIGRICMDQFMVDVTDCPDASVGDRVVLFGGDDGTMIARLAEIGETIGYEIVCGVSKRVPRVTDAPDDPVL